MEQDMQQADDRLAALREELGNQQGLCLIVKPPFLLLAGRSLLQPFPAVFFNGLLSGLKMLFTLPGSVNKASIKARQQRYDTMQEQINIRKAEMNKRLLEQKSEEEELQSMLEEYGQSYQKARETCQNLESETGRLPTLVKGRKVARPNRFCFR